MNSENLTSETSNSPMPSVRFREALLFWLKLGFISFGGPAGQIAIMHQALVENRRWLSEKRFLHALNYCMVLPGPEAQQLATYLGWLMHKTWGGVAAGVLFVLPSLLLLIGLSWVYVAFGSVPLVAGVFYGIKPAVTAIVFQAAHRMGTRALKHGWLWCVAGCSFFATAAFKLPFPAIVLLAALTGALVGRWRPDQLSGASGHSATGTQREELAFINDNTPTPEHARFTWRRFFRVLAVGLLLWAVPMLLLGHFLGWNNTLTQMGWFFTKAALLTFGGAYAVLPYVYNAAVESFAWLSPTQMMDGLAMGETTPGPLIIVVAYVGFVGAYLKEVFGPEHLFMAGAAGACTVAWFTFLPSFIFIFLGGPFIETTHNQVRFTAPLTAVTAAVVGVILNLALFFGFHTLWPAGMEGQFQWASALISTAALLALLKFKRSVIEVIAVSALIGLLLKMSV